MHYGKCGRGVEKDAIHDARQLGTRLRDEGIKAMSRGIPGGKRRLKFVKTSKRGRVCLFHQNVTTTIISFLQKGQFEVRQVIIARYEIM